MPELGTYGSVRGVPGNRHPYRDRQHVEAGAWAFSAGKKVLGWGVGYARRPNDVVQQEVRRRSLSGTSPQGRPLLQAEYFDADSAYSLVRVNPNTWGRSAQQVPAAQE